MRRRLYKCIPENSELIESIQTASKDKVTKRFYAKDIVRDHDTTDAETGEYTGPFTGFMSLATQQLDTLLTFYSLYENECGKLSVTMAANWNSSASISMELFDWYLRAGTTAWEKTLAKTYTPFSWAR